MSEYFFSKDQPKFLPKPRKESSSPGRVLFAITILLALAAAFLAGISWEERKALPAAENTPAKVSERVVFQHEEAIIEAVERVSPAVVSIIATKDIQIIRRRQLDIFGNPIYENSETQRQEIGGGTGFIISPDGMILTNRHVVEDEDADYTVFDNSGKSFEAEVLARDPIQDLAIIKIEGDESFPTVSLGESSKIRIGQTAIAIGNALGEFRNTVSAGVVSGLGREITAVDGRRTYVFEDVIQTDAAINMGNSGGPLLNLKGEVVGINVAMVIGAQNIGFSIPVDKAKRMIESVIAHGEIIYPFLGVRYVIVDENIKMENDLPVDYGAWITGDGVNPAIEPGSSAEEAGLIPGDIILELEGKKIDRENPLARIILDYDPGDRVTLKILRDGEEVLIEAVLGRRS